jgi:hypothetical protein
MINKAVNKDTMFGDKKIATSGKSKKTWDLVIDDKSGKIVFYNLLTGE